MVENLGTGEVQIEGIDLQVFSFLFTLYLFYSTFSHFSLLYHSALSSPFYTHITHSYTSLS